MRMNLSSEKAARWFLSVLFIYGGGLHVFNPAEMVRAINAFQLVHGSLAAIGAYWIPWMEVWAGVWLFSKKFRAASALLIFGLISVFTIATIMAWVRGIDLNCGCFGHMPGEAPDNYALLLLRHLGFLILSGYIFCCAIADRGIERSPKSKAP